MWQEILLLCNIRIGLKNNNKKNKDTQKNMQNTYKMQMKKERVLCKINKNAKRIY